MNWPRIIYHATDGKTKSDDGKYTYERCESQAEFNELVELGWVLTPGDIGTIQKPIPDPTQEPSAGPVGFSNAMPTAPIPTQNIAQAPEAAAETTAPAPTPALATTTKKTAKKTAKKASRRKAA